MSKANVDPAILLVLKHLQPYERLDQLKTI